MGAAGFRGPAPAFGFSREPRASAGSRARPRLAAKRKMGEQLRPAARRRSRRIDGRGTGRVQYSYLPEGADMSEGEDSGAGIDFATARGRDWPSVRQFNVFLENRLGALLTLVRRFETT